MATLSEEQVLERIRVEAKAVAPHVDTNVLDPSAHIADVGIDSVQMLELVARIEDHFGVTLPDYELSGVESVADLTRMVVRSRAEAG
jgi:acyl carrier protein